jgi:hypothetical protein
MMEQHPIPQQISSYEFKLVGDMTLKQFLKAASGVILAILINKTGLMLIIKWPLMLILAGLGLLLAFVPFEDRPLEIWMLSFFKSIYNPTIFTYKKKNENNWLDLSKNEDESDDKAKPIENKNIFVSVKKEPVGEIIKIKEKKGFFGMKNQVQKTDGKVLEENKLEKEIVFEKNIIKEEVAEDKQTISQAVEEKTTEVADWRDQAVDLNLKKERLEATGEAVFGTIPMPSIPDIANVVVGMATNWDGKIVDGVIVEIQDEHGIPSRVIKTNSLGQFRISTPLANGRYLIIAEKEGYIFDRVNVDLKGQIVEPIRIIAHN